MSDSRFICIHAHFYQPPRENPWLEEIELQDSAYPFHDWNERIAFECYGPNATSRILDEQGRIATIQNNYARISFNFGPTLLSWLEVKQPEIYQAILAADRMSAERFSGHGSALAQAYSHMILPLANARDRKTQISWGLADFQRRFGRPAEGMWLPETAVDLPTLEALAAAGLRFTILDQSQAKRWRKIGDEEWTETGAHRIDPTRVYRVVLPSGRDFAVFFYDGPIARAVAFEGLLNDGLHFAERLAGGFNGGRDWPQLMHIATDGESYGHHHSRGDMALAYALDHIERQGLAQLTNYGEYLAQNPPLYEVEIHENTAWSCAHGLGRWSRDCGCRAGSFINQSWRAPLRGALDWLRDHLAPKFQQEAGRLLRDPWAARDDYIAVMLDRSSANVRDFLARHRRGGGTGAQRPSAAAGAGRSARAAAPAVEAMPEAETTRVLELMELQRHAQLMYTSCGWFFDEISGLESVQVLQYAARAIQLGERLFGLKLEEPFLRRLERAPSNLARFGNGRGVYEQCVRPAVVDLNKVGAHYAVSSLFEDYSDSTLIYGHRIQRERHEVLESGRMRLALGRIRVTSEIVLESATLIYGVLHFGDHNLSGGVQVNPGEAEFQTIGAELRDSFTRADIPELVRGMDRRFGTGTYSLKLLFRDEQRKLLDRILEGTRAETAITYRNLYDHHAHLLRFIHDLGVPAPQHLQVAADQALRRQFLQAVQSEPMNFDGLRATLREAQEVGVGLQDSPFLARAFAAALERLARAFRADPRNPEPLLKFETSAELAASVPFYVPLDAVQNIYYDMVQVFWREQVERADSGDGAARAWIEHFERVGQHLRVRVPQA